MHTELAEIKRSVADFKISGLSWHSLFVDRALFARMWRAALLQFMAQMCGATAMKYYLPALFRALGFSNRVSLLAGGIESTLKTGFTVVEMLIIDRVGRRLTLVTGAAVMTFALMVRSLLLSLQLCDADILFRSTVPCRRYTRITRTERQTTPASCLYSSTPSVTAWALVQPLGSMAPRYGTR